MRGFGSDNHAPVHPKIMQSLIDCNIEHAPSYGTDSWTSQTTLLFQQLFGLPKLDVYFVFNGTAANVLCLSAICNSFESVLCTSVSHMNVDECGAPEKLVGCKLVPLPHIDGKLTIPELEKAYIRKGDQHFSQVSAISLTQPTELGTCYSVAEIKELCDWAHNRGLYVHIDGARIANAVTNEKTSFIQMFTQSNVDIISFGGTKNGLMFGEAVLVLNQKLSANLKFKRKQLGQLPSKTRYIAGQFSAYLQNNLWQEIAEHSLNMAKILRNQLSEFSELKFTQETQGNAVFVEIPKRWINTLKNTSFFYVWDQHSFECRLMTSWDTQQEEINIFCKKIQELTK